MTDPSVSAARATHGSAAGPASGGAGSRRLRGAGNYLALIPFLAYVGLFLILPTLVVAVGAFTTADGQFTLENVGRLFTDDVFVDAFVRSIQLAVGDRDRRGDPRRSARLGGRPRRSRTACYGSW